MPLQVDHLNLPPMCHDELRERFIQLRVSPGDDEALLEASQLLHGLYQNRCFLNDVVKAHLRLCLDKSIQIKSSAQTLSICSLGDGHYLRMSFWPTSDDPVCHSSDNRIFYYGVPHDHNFSFATIGYSGPGYASRYYEIDEETNQWQPGSKVSPKYIGEEVLSPGKCVFYRRHVDVHDQISPSESSISINIMSPASAGVKSNQFVFNPDCTLVSHVMQSRFNPVIFSMARAMQDDGVDELMIALLQRHPDPYIQSQALRSLMDNAADFADRERYIYAGMSHGAQMVRELAERKLTQLQS